MTSLTMEEQPHLNGNIQLGRPDTGAASQLLVALLIMLLLLLPVAISPFTGFLSMLVSAGAAFAATTLFAVASVRLGNQTDLSGFLLVPLLVSAFQNVYLGLMAPYTSGFFIQLALLTNIVFGASLMVGYFFARPRGPQHPMLGILLVVALAIGVFATISVVAFQAGLLAMVTSARNMLAPFLFLILGLMLAERVRVAVFLTLVAWLAWATIAFGLVEYLAARDLWGALNIEALWLKKGIPNMADWGLPANFVSSELIFGAQVRRMVSSYADPVNFGTVLFLFSMVAWFTRRWALLLACLVAVVLTISKGAVLGLLVFLTVLTWHSGNRVLFGLGAVVAGLVGATVVAYSMTHSTQSLSAHVGGLVEALRTLPDHPLGRGLGGAGVLADGTSDLRESGLGLIIGQMGVFAFVLFGTFFYGMWRWLARMADRREQVLAQALFLGLLGNIAFNEVALSPNSSGGYFMLLGLLMSTDWLRRQAALAPAAHPAEGWR